MLVCRWFLLIVCCLLFVVCGVWCVVCYAAFVVRCLMLDVWCSLCLVRVLFVVSCLLCDG